MPIVRLGSIDHIDVPEFGITISLHGEIQNDHVELDIRKLGEASDTTKASMERFWRSGGHSDTPYHGDDKS